MKEEICSNLRKMETVLGQSVSLRPGSYKEALARLEQSKVMSHVSPVSLGKNPAAEGDPGYTHRSVQTLRKLFKPQARGKNKEVALRSLIVGSQHDPQYHLLLIGCFSTVWRDAAGSLAAFLSTEYVMSSEFWSLLIPCH
jgi:hypothetical protein